MIEISSNQAKLTRKQVILVLFILILLFLKRKRKCGGSVGETTEGFTVYNKTANYSLVATSYSGDFQSPKPDLNTIAAGGSYNYEVVTSFGDIEDAEAKYNVTNSSNQTVGTLSCTFRNGAGLGAAPIIRFVKTTGPISARVSNSRNLIVTENS
ncbi:hypothetical protein M3223_06455 [Paenibacillus pasadenensis]|uniref:hypothetical protein n=1 Tax=Paenibacillus pasadenensis TaxID=217090 RepID=UPI00203FD5FC|nr:hypothetical protein [Paenibacillus pasadenensis]MCM3746994.1 hypothetical protein [Paenibacillus pasadenensis]